MLWVDLEMTGLDPQVDKIIEVGAIATDMDFKKVAEYEASIKTDNWLMRTRMIGEFWDKNDATRQALIEKCTSDEAKSSAEVEQELVDFIKDNFDLDQPIYLAGNSVHQDRKFIERYWPKLNDMLSYRMLDVSAWKIVFEYHDVKFTKPELHRAMSDIEGSINELKHYLKKVNFKKNDRTTAKKLDK